MYDQQRAKDMIADQNKSMAWEVSNVGIKSHREFFVDDELLIVEFYRKKYTARIKRNNKRITFI